MDPAAPDRPILQRLVLTVLCGGAMGTADAVPGVSGGTIALIIGFYERFIAAIAAVVGLLPAPQNRARRRAALEGLAFLIPLGAGMVTALVLATIFLVDLLVHPVGAPIVYAFFFGLVLASIPEPWRKRAASRRRHWPLATLGVASCVALSIFPLGGGSEALPLVVLAGAVAISVMLLPGVSGTLALVVLGMYHAVAGAVKTVDLAILGCFALGVVLGAGTFIPFLRWLLRRLHDDTMALLTGLMAGSLVALWPWKSHYQPRDIPEVGAMLPRAPTGAWWWPVLAATLGATLILAAELLRRRAAPAAPGAGEGTPRA